MKENYQTILNLPNFISFYRIIAFPFVLYLALAGHEFYFALFLIINLITDILDGLIARAFNMTSEFGARLDSIADIGTYMLAILGVFQFKQAAFEPHLISFGIFLTLFLSCLTFSLVKFKRLPSLHLYSWKIGGYIQGSFFFVLFAFDFYTLFYYVTIGWGILAFAEHLVIQLLLPQMKSNQKGLFWVLKNKPHD